MDCFSGDRDFVVHFPAHLNSLRELRRKFGSVCTGMNVKTKCLLAVSSSWWFSFHEALVDILNYWHAVVGLRKRDDGKGKKCEKLKGFVMTPSFLHDLLSKLRFLKKTLNEVLLVIKKIEVESTLVRELYSLLAVHLAALLGNWTDASLTTFDREVDCMLDLVDERKHRRTSDSFQEYYDAVAEKWSRTVQ